MIKYFAFAAMLLASTASNAASLSATGFFNSNYIYKGLSFTNAGPMDSVSNGTPAIQGSLDLTHEWFGMTLFTGNVNSFNAITYLAEQDMEVDAMLFAVVPVADDLKLQFNVNTFLYMRNRINNMMDFSGKILYKNMKLNLSFTPMLGWATNLGYAQFVYTPQLTDELYFTSHLGYNYISNKDWGYSNYFDYKIGLGFSKETFFAELYFTNTLFRQNFSTKRDIATDGALTLTVGKTFAIF